MAGTVNPTQAALLGLLQGAPLAGYDLVRLAEDALGDFWTVTRSQVYRELRAMAARGLVVEQESGARDRRPYALTDEGRAAFHAWLLADAGSDVVRIPLLLRLAFVDAMDPDALADLLARQRADHVARLEGYREAEQLAVAAGTQPRHLVTLRFGIRYEEAVVAWFDELPDELTAGKAADAGTG